jgi:uncharacterized membrane protein YeaQ/YmgE (transglycosylase-associated protein family)
MAPLFLFLFVGIILGLATAFIRHETWLGFFADLELGIIGAVVGGMAFVLVTRQLGIVPGGLLVSLATAVLSLTLLGKLYKDQRNIPRNEHHPPVWPGF